MERGAGRRRSASPSLTSLSRLPYRGGGVAVRGQQSIRWGAAAFDGAWGVTGSAWGASTGVIAHHAPSPLARDGLGAVSASPPTSAGSFQDLFPLLDNAIAMLMPLRWGISDTESLCGSLTRRRRSPSERKRPSFAAASWKCSATEPSSGASSPTSCAPDDGAGGRPNTQEDTGDEASCLSGGSGLLRFRDDAARKLSALRAAGRRKFAGHREKPSKKGPNGHGTRIASPNLASLGLPGTREVVVRCSFRFPALGVLAALLMAG